MEFGVVGPGRIGGNPAPRALEKGHEAAGYAHPVAPRVAVARNRYGNHPFEETEEWR